MQSIFLVKRSSTSAQRSDSRVVSSAARPKMALRRHLIVRRSALMGAMLSLFVNSAWIVPFRIKNGFLGFPDYPSYAAVFDRVRDESFFQLIGPDMLSYWLFKFYTLFAAANDEALTTAFVINSLVIIVGIMFLARRSRLALPWLILFSALFTTQMHVSLLRATPAYILTFLALGEYLKNSRIRFGVMAIAVGFHSSALLPLVAMLLGKVKILDRRIVQLALLLGVVAFAFVASSAALLKPVLNLAMAASNDFGRHSAYLADPNSSSMSDWVFRIATIGLSLLVVLDRRKYPPAFRTYVVVSLAVFAILSFSPNLANRMAIYSVGFITLTLQVKDPIARIFVYPLAVLLALASFAFRWGWFLDTRLPGF